MTGQVMADPRIAGSAPRVPGIDYKPLAPTGGPRIAGAGRSVATPRAKQYSENLRFIEEQQRAYQEEAARAQANQEKAQKKKAPMWAKALGYAAKGLQYTSASEWTRNAPVIGAYQRRLERVPGARTFLAAATNPLTYLGGAGVGLTGARAIATAGLASAAGAAAGEAALSEEGLGLDIPIVPEKYEPLVGGVAGGVASPMGVARIARQGLGGLPGVGRAVPEGMRSLGLSERQAAKVAEEAALKAERAALRTGNPSVGNVIYSADGGKTATFRKPTPAKNAIQLGWDEVATPEEALRASPLGNADYVYASVDQPTAYEISNNAVKQGSRFFDNLDDVEPGQAVVRVKRNMTKYDPQTGRPMAKMSIGPGQVDVFTRDTAGGEIAWKQIAGLTASADGPKWIPINITNDAEAGKWFHDGERWVRAETPEEFRAYMEAEKAARIAEASQLRGGAVVAPPLPEGQIPLPGMETRQFRPRGATAMASDITEGLPPGGSIFDDPTHPRWQQVAQDTATPDGGSSTNILGENMREGFGLSVNPERTQVVPFEQWTANHQRYIAEFARRNNDILSDPRKYLGTWRDPATGNVSIDIGTNILDEREAMRLMEQYNQKSMWRASDGAVVPNPRYDPTRGAEAQAAGTAVTAKGRIPNERIKASAQEYAAAHGLPTLPPEHPYVRIDPAESSRIANEYDALPRWDEMTPEQQAQTQAAYGAAAREVEAQWQWAIQNDDMRFEPWDSARMGREQPYANSAEMRADINDNNHLWFFTGGEDHPLWGQATADASGLTVNDKFRAVHDYYAHAQEGLEFGPRGEENAWLVHSQMFTPEAQKAITTETRGQNSWVNFNAGRDPNAPIVFAEQKAAIMSPRTTDWQRVMAERAGRFEGWQPSAETAAPQRMALTQYRGHQYDELDPAFQGGGVPSAELKRRGVAPDVEDRFLSYYEEGATPEKFFVDPRTGKPTARGAFKHTVEGDFRVLDLTSPEGVAVRRSMGPNDDLDRFLRTQGWDGYKVGDKGTVRLFGKRRPTAVNDVPVETAPTPGGGQLEIFEDGSAVHKAFPEGPMPERDPSRLLRGGESRVQAPVGELQVVAYDAARHDELKRIMNETERAGMSVPPNIQREFLEQERALLGQKTADVNAIEGQFREEGATARQPESLHKLFAQNEQDLAAMRAGKPRPSAAAGETRIAYKEGTESRMTGKRVDREYEFLPDGTVRKRIVIKKNGLQWENRPWTKVERTEGLEDRLTREGFEFEGGALPPDEMSPRVAAAHTKLSGLENPSAKSARTAIEKLRSEGVDVSDTESALDDFDAITRGDYDSADEFREARAEQWDNVLDSLANTDDEAAGFRPGSATARADEGVPVTVEELSAMKPGETKTFGRGLSLYRHEDGAFGTGPRSRLSDTPEGTYAYLRDSFLAPTIEPGDKLRLSKTAPATADDVVNTYFGHGAWMVEDSKEMEAAVRETMDLFAGRGKAEPEAAIEFLRKRLSPTTRSWIFRDIEKDLGRALTGRMTRGQLDRVGGGRVTASEAGNYVEEFSETWPEVDARIADVLDGTNPQAALTRLEELADGGDIGAQEFLTWKDIIHREGKATTSSPEARKRAMALLASLTDDIAPVDPRARPARGGAKFMQSGKVVEVGNWLPDTVKMKYFEGKPSDIVHGSPGRATVQDIFGKMAASEALLDGQTNWDEFARMVQDQYGIDLHAPVPGRKDTTPLLDFVAERAHHYVNSMMGKPKYRGGETINMRRIVDLIRSTDPSHGMWFEGTLPAVYNIMGEEDGDLFLKFIAATSQQKSPRDNIQLALDAFADYKLGYFDDPNYKPRGITDGVMERLRYSIEGGEPTGRKINSFYNNLDLDDYNVTIDRWMFRIFGFDDAKVANDKNVYEIIAHQTRLIADRLGMTPREVQARLWVAARREAAGGAGRGVANVVNEPYEELMLGMGKYDEMGRLMPDLEGPEGLPTAKQTLQHIIDMRERGDINLPLDTTAATQKADELVQETNRFRTGQIEASLDRARKMADEAGIEYTPEESAIDILDRVYGAELATGPRFTAADELIDEAGQAQKQMQFAGMEAAPEEVIDYNPTAYAARSAELDEWARAGALDHETLPQDLVQIRDSFREQARNMSPEHAAVRYQKDARTAEWQKRILAEERPEAVEAPIGRSEKMSARPFGLFDKRKAVDQLSGEVSATQQTAARLREELTASGVPEERIDEIIRSTLGSEQSPGTPTAGQALRGASRAEALAPNPRGTGASLRVRAAQAPRVNDRPVVAVPKDFPESREAADEIQSIIADSEWAGTVDKEFADAVDFAVGIFGRTEYRLDGTGPRSGGLFYESGTLGFYNDVALPAQDVEGALTSGVLPRAETTIHVNPVDVMARARRISHTQGTPLPEELANDVLETGLHEVAHDIAFHPSTRRANMANREEQFHNVLKAMKEAAEGDIETYRQRLIQKFQSMEQDGTLVKWENDSARVRWTAERASVRNARNYATQRQPDLVGQAPLGDVEGGPLEVAARGVRGEGVPESLGGRGGEPAGSVRAGVGGSTEPAAVRGSRSRVVRRGLDELGTRDDESAARIDTGTGPAPAGAPSSLEPERIKTRTPRVLEEAGSGREFEAPLPEGRLTSAPRAFEEVKGDIFKNDALRRVATRMSKDNGLIKRVLDAGVGKSATAVTDWERDIATFIVKREADRSRVVAALSELRQGKRPYTRMEGDLTRVTDWRGNEVIVPLSDVLSNPKFFRLTKAQEGWNARYNRIVDELVADARSRGIDIKISEKQGERYIPRWVIGADDVDLEYDYVKPGIGSKQPFEKPRFYRTAKEGMDKGIRYNDTEAALARFADSIMKRTREEEIVQRLKKLGRTSSEFLGEEAKVPLKVVSKRAQAAKVAWQEARRALTSAEKAEAGRAGAAKPLSSNDIRAMVNRDPAVATAKEELEAAAKTKNAATRKYNAAKTDAAQERAGAQLDIARSKWDNANDALKDVRKSTRERIVAADRADIEKRGGTGSAKVKAARERVDELKAEYDNQMKLVKQTKADYRSRLQSHAAPFRAEARQFPGMGLKDDVVPVRQTRDIPALQGRFFPEPVIDVIEKSLADKGSRALMNVAAVNDLARMFTTSTDFGATMLQGIPVLATNPGAWAKATVKSIQSWANPRSLQKYYAANREAINEMSHYAGGLSGNEFFSSAVGGGETLIGKAAKADIPALSVPGQAVERFGVAFDAFLDVSKIEMWKAMRSQARNTQDLEDLGRLIRNLTGTTSTARAGVGTTQRQIESLLMFSPRFTRSVFAVATQAMQGGPGGAAARRSLAGLIAGGMFAYAATKKALGQELSPKDFDPRSGGRFMSVKVGDNWVGIGGSMRGAIQLLGTAGAAAVTDPKKLFSGETTGLDANPFLKYARGRSSPAAGEVWNLVTGKDAIGEEYEGRGEWLSKLPDAFIPFAVQAVVETEGGAGTRAGILGAQSVGLRTFPESTSEDLNASLKDALKRIPTDTPGFSQKEMDEVDEWADLTKFQKQTLLQRRPELARQLDKKEQDFWNERKKLTADYENAKRDLSQQYLETQRKTAAGEALTVDDITAQQYREALADIEDRHRTAEAQLRGANAITGIGGEDFPYGPRTHRQQVINDYYNAMDSAQFVDPETGQLDFNKRDEVETAYLSNLPQSERDIITQERGAEYDSVARDLKAAKMTLAPYWEIGDRIARQMGYSNAAELDVYANPHQKKLYRKRSDEAKERFRRANPEVDSLLVNWGYASKGINEREDSSGSLLGGGKRRKLVKRISLEL